MVPVKKRSASRNILFLPSMFLSFFAHSLTPSRAGVRQMSVVVFRPVALDDDGAHLTATELTETVYIYTVYAGRRTPRK